MTEPTQGLYWIKSRRCGSSTCVEVAFCGEHVLVRDSKDRPGDVLSFRKSAWQALVESAKDGEFDTARG